MFSSKKKPEKIVCSGNVGECSPQQQAALVQFRKIVIKENNNQNNPKWDDYFLLRFLRARKFHIGQTLKMWSNYIQWRKKNEVDRIQYFKFPELVQLRKNYPHGYHKTDKKFRPIYIERVGHLQMDKIFKFTTNERLLQYFTLQYQTLLNTIFTACTQMRKRETGQQGKVQQTCTILDLKNVSLSMAPKTYDFVKPASKLTQDNYPQILGNMFIINAPMLFTGIWAIVKGWIDQKTRSKIKILGSSFKKELYEVCDPQSIPRFIDGGKCNCPEQDCIIKNYGPWNPKGEQMYPYAIGLKCKLQQDEQDAKKQEQDDKLRQQTERLQRFQQQELQKKQQFLRFEAEVEEKRQQKKQEKQQDNNDLKYNEEDIKVSKSDERKQKEATQSNPEKNAEQQGEQNIKEKGEQNEDTQNEKHIEVNNAQIEN